MKIETLKTIPLEDLENLVNEQEEKLEILVELVNEQEYELNTQIMLLKQLEARDAKGNAIANIKNEQDKNTLIAEQKEKNEMLEKTLIAQRRNVEEKEAILTQHLQELLQRKGVLSIDNKDRQNVETLMALLKQTETEKPETKTSINSDPKWQKWLISIGIGILLILGIYSLRNITTANQSNKTITNPPSDVEPNLEPEVSAVTSLGRIEPKNKVTQISAPASLGTPKVAQLFVEEGQQVQQGQIIAILQERERRLAALEKAKKEVEVAQANLNIVKAGAKAGEIQAQQATIARLQAQLEGEKIAKEAYISRLEAQLDSRKKAQQATITRLKSEYNNAEVEYERYRQLTLDGATSQSALDRQRTLLETARERVNEADADLDRIVNTLTQEILEARAVYLQTVNTLKKSIEEAEANLVRIAEVRDVDVQKAQAEIGQAVANLKEAQSNLDLVEIKAPTEGQILKIHSYPGETVNSQQGIVEMGNTNQMMVIAEIYESDIGQVEVGQPVIIESESGAFKEELKGTVSEIGMQVGKKNVFDSDPAADVDVRVVEVKVKLDEESSELVKNLTYARVIVKILI